jgi:hypothetical protein
MSCFCQKPELHSKAAARETRRQSSDFAWKVVPQEARRAGLYFADEPEQHLA